MELDATVRQTLSPQEKEKRIKQRLCFNCGKEGHMARNCKQGRRPNKQFGRRNELNATMQARYHGTMQLNATLQEPVDGIADIEIKESTSYAIEREEPPHSSQFERRFFEHLGIGPEQQKEIEQVIE